MHHGASPRRTPRADHSHQSTGLSACCSRYGDVAFSRRFATALPSPITGASEALAETSVPSIPPAIEEPRRHCDADHSRADRRQGPAPDVPRHDEPASPHRTHPRPVSCSRCLKRQPTCWRSATGSRSSRTRRTSPPQCNSGCLARRSPRSWSPVPSILRRWGRHHHVTLRDVVAYQTRAQRERRAALRRDPATDSIEGSTSCRRACSQKLRLNQATGPLGFRGSGAGVAGLFAARGSLAGCRRDCRRGASAAGPRVEHGGERITNCAASEDEGSSSSDHQLPSSRAS